MMVVALGLVLVGTAGARAGADTEPVIVVPGRPGVPIMIDGQDVRGAVIEGEWGLARGHTGVTIIPPRPLISPWWYPGRGPTVHVSPAQAIGRFFPGTGRQPRLGRQEVIPPANRPLPPKAESYERNWKSESQQLPANLEPPPFPMLPMHMGVDAWGRRHGPRQDPRQDPQP
jgi:hypothetical protein